jgi:hypothetical protein
VELQGEELEIRRYETDLGNWIADQAGSALAGQGAQAALLNPSAWEGTRLTLLAPDRGRPISPDEDLCVATIEFLIDARGGQDGYTMLTQNQVASSHGTVIAGRSPR